MRNKRLAQLLALQKAEPKDAFLKYAIAQEHLSANETSEAIEWFEKVLNDHPEYLPTYYHFGKLLYEVGKEDRSNDLLEKGKSLAEAQGNQKTANEIGELLEDLFW